MIDFEQVIAKKRLEKDEKERELVQLVADLKSSDSDLCHRAVQTINDLRNQVETLHVVTDFWQTLHDRDKPDGEQTWMKAVENLIDHRDKF